MDPKESYKYAKEFEEQYGDDEQAVYDMGILPEVVITPSHYDK